MADVTLVPHFIAGEWAPGLGEDRVSINPASPSSPVAQWKESTDVEVHRAITAAHGAFPDWRRRTAHDRGDVLRRAAILLRQRAEAITDDLVREQGKLQAVALGEVGRASDLLDYFAHEAQRSVGATYNSPRPHERIFTHRVPLGPVLIISPWNVPLAIPAWKIAPALVHGNTVVWKPSEEVPRIAAHLMQALHDGGLPPGVCNMLLGGGRVAERVLSDTSIRACSFTGSTAVGRRVLVAAAKRNIPALAEMGGMNAAIVLADADLDLAAHQIVMASTGWAGQRCTATSRVLVEHAVADQLVDRIVGLVSALRVGSPEDPKVHVGPVTTQRQFEALRQATSRATSDGGTVVAGGILGSAADGYFVEPIVICGLADNHPLSTEETFGPLVVVHGIDSLEHGLRIANDSKYGLSGSLFTTKLESAFVGVEQFEVGVLHVNSESTGADPHVPFGGFKDSGTPQKEMGDTARDFFTQVKTIYLRS